jgi:hypothetical protein
MQLPNAEQAIVPSRKITDYLLSTSHRDGQHKAAFFCAYGFTTENRELLASALLKHVQAHEVVETVSTAFGQKYVVEGHLITADGRNPKVRTVWFIAKNQEVATLVTAYPIDDD